MRRFANSLVHSYFTLVRLTYDKHTQTSLAKKKAYWWEMKSYY